MRYDIDDINSGGDRFRWGNALFLIPTGCFRVFLRDDWCCLESSELRNSGEPKYLGSAWIFVCLLRKMVSSVNGYGDLSRIGSCQIYFTMTGEDTQSAAIQTLEVVARGFWEGGVRDRFWKELICSWSGDLVEAVMNSDLDHSSAGYSKYTFKYKT